MPREPKRGKPQTARRRRVKAHDPADWTSRRPKARFPFSLFSNAKIFYLLGASIMVASVAGGVFTVRRGSTSTPDFVTPAPTEQVEGTVQPTPESTAIPTLTARQYDAPPEMTIDPADIYVADIHTAKGDIRIELFPGEAPEAVNNFIFLCREGFYDGLTFHRVVPGFVAQAGDPLGDGTGGPGYYLPDEQNNLPHEAGALAMARTQDGRVSGSQFYITYEPQPILDERGFTVFGKVIDGMDVLQSLTAREPGQPDAPPGDEILSIDIE